MPTPFASPATLRFDEFEADLRSGELLKAGVKLKLEGQPFQILAMLLARPGALVTREELRKELWPEDTFVDFEQGINAAVKRLRAALEDSAEKPRLIETLPRRGYRFIGQVHPALRPIPFQSGDSEASSVPTKEVARPFLLKKHDLRNRIALGLAVAAIVIVLTVSLNVGGLRDRMRGRPRSSEVKAGEITSIIVLPFQNLTADPEGAFADQMTDGVINQLGKIKALQVRSLRTSMSFKDSKQPLPNVARQLEIDGAVEGSVKRNGDQIFISARLVQASPERVVWARDYEDSASRVFSLQSRIALDIAAAVKLELSIQERSLLSQTHLVDPRAYEAFSRGRYFQAARARPDMQKALEYFQEAIRIDPEFARAYVGIMDCYAIGGGRQMPVSIKEADANLKAAARKVIELDGDSAEGHYAQAQIKWHEWDFLASENEFRRSLELNPGDLLVRQQYSHFLLGMQRPEDSRREIKEAMDRDPRSPMLAVDLGHTYLYSRQFPLAIEQGEKALAMQKDFTYARAMLSSAYWYQGLIEKAFENGWPSPLQPDWSRRAKEIYVHSGKEPMLRSIRTEVERGNPSGNFGSRSAEVARWYALTDDKERTLAWLEKAYREHEPWLPLDLAKPEFDKFRSDPRFRDLLRRVGIDTFASKRDQGSIRSAEPNQGLLHH